VVHFGEWTTGYLEKGRIPAKATKWREPVVHFKEWSTSYPEKGRNPAKAPKKLEPVVHFGKWTTGFPENGRIRLSPYNCVKRKSQVISGTM